jgi:hypothetical protein
MYTYASLLFCLLAFAVPAAAQNADVTGRWDVLVSMTQGPPTPGPLELKKEADKIVGVFSTPQGDRQVEASVKGKEITIWFTIPTRNGPVSATMNGTVAADTMKGTVDVTGHGRGQWSAKRAAAAPAASASGGAAIDVTGTWTFDVRTHAGSGTPTLTLEQDGEKLTGRYSGQLGQAPLTGTIRHGAIEFAFDVTLDGTALHVVYSGSAPDSTSMKGTVTLGELGDGTFTGRKQR